MRPVQGSMDPRECRLVLHGHISEGGITAEGVLSDDEVSSRISEVCSTLLADLPDVDLYQGLLTVRMNIAASGKVVSARALSNRLMPTHPTVRDSNSIVRPLIQRLASIIFSPQTDRTVVTVPVIL